MSTFLIHYLHEVIQIHALISHCVQDTLLFPKLQLVVAIKGALILRKWIQSCFVRNQMFLLFVKRSEHPLFIVVTPSNIFIIVKLFSGLNWLSFGDSVTKLQIGSRIYFTCGGGS